MQNLTTRQTKSSRDCFLICPIGPAGSPIRKRADDLLELVLAPVLKSAGYTVVRADKIAKVGMITGQVLKLVIESPLVVADLTGGNPNVFYELALRHATGLPYIQLADSAASIPFDIAGIRTILIDIADLRSVDLAKAEIKRQIAEFANGHRADSPIALARSVSLLQSDSAIAEDLLRKLSSLDMNAAKNAQRLERLNSLVNAMNHDLGFVTRAIFTAR